MTRDSTKIYSMAKKHNFGAGPCILPQEVFQQAAKAVLDFNGLSILEVSHRDKDFMAVMEEARMLVKKVLNVPDDYTVLYLQGGASLGFLIAAMNMCGKNRKAAYVETGVWAKKAAKEAKLAGLTVDTIANSADKNYSYIPKGFKIGADYDYVHYTSNNTIYGTQFREFPKSNIPLVCDMSSDIFSKKINVADYHIIYAGAQKNLGPAGATLFIVKNSVLGNSTYANIPSYLDLKNHAENESMYNTPPCFSVYVSMLNLRHLIANGGLEAMEKKNEKKAALLYAEIDSNPLFKGTVEKEDRSNMNVCFVCKDESLTEQFQLMCKEAGLIGLKGHRSVGGFRASLYNACEISDVEVLVNTMKSFAKKNVAVNS